MARPHPGRHGGGRRAAGPRSRRHPPGRPGTAGPPTSAEDDRNGPQRRADALAELARRALEDGRLPTGGGVRPQLTITAELASLLGQAGLPGGDGGGVGPLPVEPAQRLACDAAVTRVLVTRHHDHDPHHDGDLPSRLRAAIRLLPPALGGGPTQPLEVGRATRVVSAAQRTALAVRDGGCRYPGCDQREQILSGRASRPVTRTASGSRGSGRR